MSLCTKIQIPDLRVTLEFKGRLNTCKPKSVDRKNPLVCKHTPFVEKIVWTTTTIITGGIHVKRTQRINRTLINERGKWSIVNMFVFVFLSKRDDGKELSVFSCSFFTDNLELVFLANFKWFTSFNCLSWKEWEETWWQSNHLECLLIFTSIHCLNNFQRQILRPVLILVLHSFLKQVRRLQLSCVVIDKNLFSFRSSFKDGKSSFVTGDSLSCLISDADRSG